jgi:uncharacterized protein (DUF58 family)
MHSAHRRDRPDPRNVMSPTDGRTTFAVTPLGMALALVAIVAGLAGVITRQRDFVVLGAPAAAALVHALARAPGRDVELTVTLDADAERVLVGDELTVRVAVTSPAPIGRVHAAVRVLAPLQCASVAQPLHTFVIGAEPSDDDQCTYQFPLHAATIGRASVGPVALRWHDPIGVVRYERVSATARTVRVIPSAAVIRSLVAAAQTGAHFGEQVARSRADGFEFADMRPWRPGDPAARINWRASARRDEPWVIDRHPDRNEDVVLFVDSFADAHGPGARSSLASSLEIAAAIGSAHLARRDRVGFVGYGGLLQWLVPAAGQLARYRLVDAMVETVVFTSQATKDVGVIPVRALPTRALVIAVTALLDDRGTTAIRDLVGRGHDVAVIAVDPLTVVEALPDDASDVQVLGRRLWALEQERQRRRIATSGAAVIRWTCPEDGALTDLAAVLTQLTDWRHRSPSVRGGRGGVPGR